MSTEDRIRGAILDPEAAALLDAGPHAPDSPSPSWTAEGVRAEDVSVLRLQRSPAPLYSIEDIVVDGPAGPIRVRSYRPGHGPLTPVLFLHGGGFVIGPDGYDAPLRDLALASGCLIIAPQCRLAPEHPFPAPLEDALAVARWLRAHAVAALGARDLAPAVIGDSSGGNLAAVTTDVLAREGTPPSFQVLIYPMLDALATSPSYQEFADGYGFTAAKSQWYFDQYLPPHVDRASRLVSPLLNTVSTKIPRTLVVTAECDPLRDDGERYALHLRHAGVHAETRRYDGMIHGFFQMTGALTQSGQLLDDIGAWIRRVATA